MSADADAVPGPFAPGDQVAYDELTAEQRGWRVVMHLLAVTGRTITIPTELSPRAVDLMVAAGWRYVVGIAATASDGTAITCTHATWPPTAPVAPTQDTPTGGGAVGVG